MGCSDSKSSQTENQEGKKPENRPNKQPQQSQSQSDRDLNNKKNESPKKESPRRSSPSNDDDITVEDAILRIRKSGESEEEAAEICGWMSKDKQGHLSQNEVDSVVKEVRELKSEAATIFKEVDCNGTKKASMSEVLYALQRGKFDEDGDDRKARDDRQRLRIRAKFLKEHFMHCDKDKKGDLSKAEFANFYTRMKMMKYILKVRFKESDKDNSGYLTLEELTDCIKQSSGLDQEDCLEAAKEAIADNSGKIKLDDFLVLWADEFA